jgi:hypothetical protein
VEVSQYIAPFGGTSAFCSAVCPVLKGNRPASGKTRLTRP